MINNRIYNQLFVLLFILFIQFYIPSIIFSSDLMLFPDLLLIYLVYLSILYDRYYVIFFGFVLGLFQDFVVQVDMIGSYALIKPFTVYFLGVLKSFSHQWSNLNKMFYNQIQHLISSHKQLVPL